MFREDDVFSAIARIQMTACPECGQQIPRYGDQCDECGHVLEAPHKEEEPAVSMLADAPRGRPVVEINGEIVELDIEYSQIPPADYKIPLAESKNLIKVRQAKDGILSGTMDLEEYARRVNEVAEVAFLACEMLKLPAVHKQIEENAIEGDDEMIADTERTLHDWLAGMKRMRRYLASQDLRDVVEGFQAVEECMIRMDSIQDRALSQQVASAA
ncbi:MAG: hypothetical protein HY319_21415 [Armatimonadetes bacterium]|nr:hypothetical protein [Armatimonadota bacterium]